ncbi:hypothetical protein ACFLZ1_03825 [Patescibacteria group bacterium]
MSKKLKKYIFSCLALLLVFVFFKSFKNKSLEPDIVLTTAKQAADLGLKHTQEWDDASIVSLENTLQVNKNGLGDSWLVFVISESENKGIIVKIKNGQASLLVAEFNLNKQYLLLDNEYIDSDEALKLALEAGLTQNKNYSMFLGRYKDLEKYGQTVWNINTVLHINNKTKTPGIILDPKTGQKILKY